MLPPPGPGAPGHPDLRRYVLPTEVVVLATRKHWAVLLRPITVTIAVFLLVAAMGEAGPAGMREALSWLWLAFAAALLHLAYRWLEWRREWFIATDKRLLLLYGLIIHKVAMMPLTKVTDMGYTRSPAGYVFGYGRFVLESAGQDQAMSRIDYVPRPDPTYRTLCGELFKPAPGQTVSDVAPPVPGPPPAPPAPELPIVVPGRPAAGGAPRPTTQPIPLPRSK